MKWIRKIKNTINKKKNTENENSITKKSSGSQFQKKNTQTTTTTKEKTSRYDYENFRKLKVYKRPVIKNTDEREQLFHKISEELRNLD